MREIELPLPMAVDCVQAARMIDDAIESVGLRTALRASLKNYPGCIHWHVKNGNESGTLEITLWPSAHRAWFSIQAGRAAPWIESKLKLLAAAIQQPKGPVMSKAQSNALADKLALYEKLIATRPDVERKGASMPYTSCNGHMFSFLTESGTMALRLGDADCEAFLKKYRTTLCERHGTVMKEFVEVPDALLKKTKELKRYFGLSVNHVTALKPKATTRKKAAKKK